jgi:hypothetical protein
MIAWITYTPNDAVKIKFPINKLVDYDERLITQTFNTNLRRVLELCPDAANELHLVKLEGENDDIIQY